MDFETLAYLLYMDNQDKIEEQKQKEKAAAIGNYQVSSNDDLVDGWGTHTENLD